MPSSTPTRVDDDLFAAAKTAAQAMSRSASQQINHWARIGRELESSRAVSQRDIAAVLAAEEPYDDLAAREQAVVRAVWEERMAELREGLDLASEFRAAGDTWSEADAAGRVERAATAGPPRRRGR